MYIGLRNANEFFSNGAMSPQQAAQYLREESITLRSFRQELLKMVPEEGLAARLTAAFCQNELPERHSTLRRNIYNWISGKSTPSRREDVFHIAFALSLSEPQVNLLLEICSDYGIHYREGRDVVYAWFLRMGKSFGEARAFFDSLPPAPHFIEAPVLPNPHLTFQVRDAFLLPRTEEELFDCYQENLANFGRLHTRAYFYFDRYFNCLRAPEDSMERPFSTEEVTRQYLSLHMPISRSRAGFTAVQRLVKQGWPNATQLKNIRLRKTDVPRKLLLLLYVVTENSLDEKYLEADEEYISPEEQFEDHWVTLNAMLADCGMPPLDPRVPTDWLVLYALTAQDEPMSQRMEQVIDGLYDGLAT